MYQWKQTAQGMELLAGDQLVLTIPGAEGCTDTFEELGEGEWKWIRKSDKPLDRMKMTVCQQDPIAYWQVPCVNYNGNGWGSGAQYAGYGCDGENWTYAWHRIAIPACTYAESEKWTVGLFGGEEGGMSCSIWEEEGCARQALLWPEVEGPKVLSLRTWWERFEGTMEPASIFVGYLRVAKRQEPRLGYQGTLDYAWRLFDRPVKMSWSPEELIKLDTLWFRQLYHKKYDDGVTGFASGMNWREIEQCFRKDHMFEIGWAGQNASISCIFLREYLKTGDTDLRDQALATLDSWVKYGVQPNGLIFAQLRCDPQCLDSITNGTIPVESDACNLGVAATYFFKAAKLCKEAGIERPAYLKTALGLCDFALKAMKPNGELAKSWLLDGTVASPHGSVGCFFVLPLFDAYEVTGDKKYLDAALKGYGFYYNEFHQSGVTTAGALDSFCIDKESAAPVLRAALRAYHVTGDKAYVAQAEEIAYYLATWQFCYSVPFAEDSMAKRLPYDTFGGTSVSAAHNAIDPYGIYYVPEYLELAELTGKEIWRSRARALWYNGTLGISDGSLVVKGHVRPIGSQDESCRHTRWSRTDRKTQVMSGWLSNWQGTYRQVALEMIKDWDVLR